MAKQVAIEYFCDETDCTAAHTEITVIESNRTLDALDQLPPGWAEKLTDDTPVHFCPVHAFLASGFPG